MADRSRWDYLASRGQDGTWANMSADEHLRYGHDSASRYPQSLWADMAERLIGHVSGSGYRRLSYIEIDIANAYCPNGCCRPSVPIEKLLAITPLAHVVIRGAIDEDEKKGVMVLLREYYQDYEDEHRRVNYDEIPHRERTVEQIKRMHNIQFDPEKDVWAWNCKKAIRKPKDKKTIAQR
jgi:hypothetical protein